MQGKALLWVAGAAIAGWMAPASYVLGAASLVAKEHAVDTGNERVVAEHGQDELFIEYESADAPHHESLRVNGYLEAYVRCGSQLSVWSGFPAEVRFTVADEETGETFEVGGDFPENISWDASVYDYYRTLPCDQRVRKDFSLDLVRDLGLSLPTGARRLRIEAAHFGTKSNVVVAEPGD